MKKIQVLQKIAATGVVAVIRADSAEEAVQISHACISGGITSIEITFTTPNADIAISELVKVYGDQACIGAGTVLDAVTARIAIMAGAEFVVSPGFDEDTAKLCNLYQIPFMPGCLTITEMKKAMEHGVDVVKLFPGNAFGPDYIKAVKAPLPQVNIMPTGGVDSGNIDQWIKNGCVAVGIGGNLVSPAKNNDFAKITELAKQYVQKVEEARQHKLTTGGVK